MEQWRDIDGFEGLYEVSDLGRVRSLDREVERLTRWGGLTLYRYKGHVLRLQRCSNKYYFVRLGKGRSHLVHRLVAAAFIPGDTNLQVNHKNGIRNDNRAENLEWVTCSENHFHSYETLPRKKHSAARRVVVRAGKEHYFPSVSAAAQWLRVSPGAVSSAAIAPHRCKGYEVRYV